MGDVAILVCVLCVFYLHDCSLWLGRDTAAFIATGFGRWRPVRPHPQLSGATKGLLLSFRLPPLTPVYLSYPWSIAASPTHVCPMSPAGTSPTAPPHAFDAIQDVTAADATVIINGTPFTTCEEPFLATTTADLIRGLVPLSATRRQAVLESAIAAALDPAQLQAAIESLAHDGLLLRVYCNVLFVYFFLGLPVAVASLNLLAAWPHLLAILVALVAVVAIEFRRLHIARWPTERAARRNVLIRLCLFPPLAMRAHDFLAHRVAAHFHPLTLALVLVDPRTADQITRRTLRQLRHPLSAADEDPVTAATLAWCREAEERAIRTLLASRRVEADDYLTPPPHIDGESRTYCPRCETAYTVHSGTCSDCPGVALVAYPLSATEPAATAPNSQVTP
jgi:hypothetical protein